VTAEEIKRVFSEAGKIISTNIRPSKKSIDGEEITVYQFGYILFDKVEEA